MKEAIKDVEKTDCAKNAAEKIKAAKKLIMVADENSVQNEALKFLASAKNLLLLK